MKEVSGTALDLKTFLDFVKREGQPALAALLGNAFRLLEDRGQLNFQFDRSHGALIPMVKGAANFKQIQDLCLRFFNKRYDLNFSIGNDPKLKAKREREEKAMETVMANPKVQFILEQFGGKIIKVEIMDKSED